MTFEQFEKARPEDLKAQAKECFDLINSPQIPNEFQVAKLLEAQFYMQELDRRHGSWVATRDLILEIVVIVLIGAEIVLAVKQGVDEGVMMDKQNAILSKLNDSSSATATSMRLLAGMTKAMSDDIRTTSRTLGARSGEPRSARTRWKTSRISGPRLRNPSSEPGFVRYASAAVVSSPPTPFGKELRMMTGMRASCGCCRIKANTSFPVRPTFCFKQRRREYRIFEECFAGANLPHSQVITSVLASGRPGFMLKAAEVLRSERLARHLLRPPKPANVQTFSRSSHPGDWQ